MPTITSPAKAIRAYCLGCCNGSSNEVKLCVVEECELYPFRFGKNPYRSKKEYSDEERMAVAERFKNAQQNK